MQFSPPSLGILAKPLSRCSFVYLKVRRVYHIVNTESFAKLWCWLVHAKFYYIVQLWCSLAVMFCNRNLVKLLSYLKFYLVFVSGFTGPLQVQQVFTSSGAINADHWVFPPFCCLHHLYECRLDNLKVFTILFSEAAVGWGFLAYKIHFINLPEYIIFL